MTENNLIKKAKTGDKKSKILLFVLALVLVVAIAFIVVVAPSGKSTISVKTSLKEVLENSQLSTAEYTYNSIVKIVDEENSDEIKYYIAYKGTVKSGFDFEKLDFVEDEKGITVVVPKIEIQQAIVNEELEYIFTNKKYDTENTYAEAYNACCKDLEKKAKSNKTLYNTAIESAIETITAITKPFEKTLEEGKTITVVYVDDYAKEGK